MAYQNDRGPATTQWIGFNLADSTFALDVSQVEEVTLAEEITPFPNLPASVEGVINLRGKLVPIINLKTTLGLGECTIKKTNRIVVTRIKERLVGLRVENVVGVIDLMSSSVFKPRKVEDNIRLELIKAAARIGRERIFLVDIEKIIN